MKQQPPSQEEEQTTEAAPTIAIKAPYQPTQKEIDDHNPTHLPYRSWCRHCVRGRGKSLPHRHLDAEQDHTVPTVSLDYCFLGQPDDENNSNFSQA